MRATGRRRLVATTRKITIEARVGERHARRDAGIVDAVFAINRLFARRTRREVAARAAVHHDKCDKRNKTSYERAWKSVNAHKRTTSERTNRTTEES